LQSGETEHALNHLLSWRETDLYTEQKRRAGGLTEAMTLLPDGRHMAA
jgi:alkylhydroperoxidase family enzyme